MRGAYAAGVLSGLLRAGEEFDAFYASSSGACSSAYMAAGQVDAVRVWEELLHGQQLIRWTNPLRGRPCLDLDYLIDDVFGRQVPLDVEALRRSRAGVWVTLTNATTGDVEYRDLRRERNPLDALRGSAALPLAYGRPVVLDGQAYLDGGMADPIPVKRALDDGATDITVVLTRPMGYRRTPSARWVTWLASRPYPTARCAIDRMHERYNAALDAIGAPPEGVTVRAIAPPTHLRLTRMMRGMDDLRRAVAQGAQDAMRITATRPAP